MMQVENEVGVLGDTRDHSEAANQAFAGAVPAQLTAYLAAHREELYPDLRELWKANGAKDRGHVDRGVWRRRAGRRDLHGVAVRAVYARRGGARQGRIRHSHVCEHVAAVRQYSARGVSERRFAAARGRCVESRRDGDRFLFSRFILRQILRSGASAITAMAIRSTCRRRAAARRARPTCFMRWARRRGLASRRSASSRRLANQIRWARATRRLRL